MKKPFYILKLRNFSLVCLFLSIFFNITSTFTGITFLAMIGVSLLLIFIVISLVFWRCPICKKRLPARFSIKGDVNENFCPYCNSNFLYDELKK